MILRNVALVSASLFAMQAYAAESSVKFTLVQPILNYESSSDKTTPDVGASSKTETTSLGMPANATELWIQHGQTMLYLYPAANDYFGISRLMMNDTLEVGANIGINDLKVKDGNETSATKFGLFAYYYVNAGPVILEPNLAFNIISDKSETVTAATATAPAGTSKTNNAGTEINLGVNVVYALDSRLDYVGGLTYNMTNMEEKESKTEMESSSFSIMLSSLRLKF